MGKRLATVGLAAALAGGSVAVAAANPLTVAGATSSDATTSALRTEPDPATEGARHPHRKGPLERALDGLVADGTLTQDQADEVLAATRAEAEEGRARRRANRTEMIEVVAEAIGSTPEEVKEGLKAGTSIAEQAKAAGVDRKVVGDAVTAELTARIDEAVEAGTITAERAEKAKARLDKAVDRILDADGHRLRDRRGRAGRGAGQGD